MQSPNATPSSALSVQALPSSASHARSASNTPNGFVNGGAVQEQAVRPEGCGGAMAEGTDLIRAGKEKAKAVMAASGVTLAATPEQRTTPKREQIPSRAGSVNGAAQSRKRSRSGSRLPLQRAFAPASIQADQSDQSDQSDHKKHLLYQYITRDQLHAAALNDQAAQIRATFTEKHKEVNYYKEVRQHRQMDPGAIFGYGYAGYGNGITNDKARLVYPAQRRRVANRRARELHISRKDAATQAEQLEELVPVRLDIEFDKLKLRDTFTWNLHDRVVPPELFAETLVEDFRLPPEVAPHIAQQINRELQEHIQDYYPHVFIREEPLDPHLPYFAYKDDEMRVLIKLNITIGPHTLVDQFEWDINNPLNNPEEFARQMARDLNLAGEFTTAIAHCIREQCQMFTKSLYITGHPFDGRSIADVDVRDAFLPSPLLSVFRPAQSAKDYTPYVYELSEADLQREEMSMLREQRRQKRSVNRRGGPALPDMKDRQRTVRTLVMSSVLPGAAETVESSRLYKMSRASGRGRRTTGRADGGDDSDESDSEDSSPESPMIPAQTLPGTARTRGIRGAATAAQAAMRANIGRSATPELASLHHHETRTSARRYGGHEEREESVAEPTKLIVTLRISREKYRRWMHSQKDRRSGEYQQGYASTSLMPSQNNTPQPSNSAASSMLPPPSPAMQQRINPTSAARGLDVQQQLQAAASSSSGGQQPIYYYPDGRADAPYPIPPGQPAPPCPVPPWLATALSQLQERYAHDSFEGLMRYQLVDSLTGQTIQHKPDSPIPPNTKYQYVPRIRCNDCPGKLYTVGPERTVENFEVHLRNREHKTRVEGRRRGAGGGRG